MTLQMLAGCCLVLGALQAAPPQSRAPQSSPPPAQRQPAVKPAQTNAGVAKGITREAEAYYQFLLGRHLESEGDTAAALVAYTEAARLDPKSAEICAEIAALHARENRIAEATAMAEAALKLDSRNVSATRLLGFIYADAARVDEGTAAFDPGAAASAARAAGYLETARRGLEMPDPAVEMVLGRIYLRSGANDKAVAVLSQLVVDLPGQPEPANLLLQAYLQAGRTDEATRTLEAAVGLQPQFLPMLAELYERQRRWADAAGAYASAIERTPKNLELRTRLAAVLLSDGGNAEVGRALALLEQVRRESPADRRVLYLLAQAQREAGRLDDAEATARQLIALAPGSPTGAYVLGLVLGQKQQYRSVVETLEPIVGASASTSAAGAEGDLLPVLLQLGFAYLELGDADCALATFERAQKLSPGDPTVEFALIEAQLAARRYAEAAALARKMRGTQPANPHLLRLEAEALRQSGKGDEGTTLLADAIASRPDDVAGYTALAEFEAARARYDAALAVLARAGEKFPGDITVTFVAGRCTNGRSGSRTRSGSSATCWRRTRCTLRRSTTSATCWRTGASGSTRRSATSGVRWRWTRTTAPTSTASGGPTSGRTSSTWPRKACRRPRRSALAIRRSRTTTATSCSNWAATRTPVSAWQRALDGDGEQIDRGAIDRKMRSAREKLGKH